MEWDLEVEWLADLIDIKGKNIRMFYIKNK
jgi:hypothetical protein